MPASLPSLAMQGSAAKHSLDVRCAILGVRSRMSDFGRFISHFVSYAPILLFRTGPGNAHQPKFLTVRISAHPASHRLSTAEKRHVSVIGDSGRRRPEDPAEDVALAFLSTIRRVVGACLWKGGAISRVSRSWISAFVVKAQRRLGEQLANRGIRAYVGRLRARAAWDDVRQARRPDDRSRALSCGGFAG